MSNDDLRVSGATKARPASKIAGALTTNGDIDYGGAGESPITGDSLSLVRGLAATLVERLTSVQRAEAALEKAKKELEDIAERRLPDLMQQHGLPKFEFLDETTGNLYTIKLEADKWRVSMPANDPENEPKRREIFQWLRMVDLGGIIQKNMVVPLGLVGDNQATDLMIEFKTAHPDLEPGLEEKVHPSTLTSQISKLKNKGIDVHPALNVLPVRRATVKGKETNSP